MHWELLSSVQGQNAKAHLGANLLRIWDDGCFYDSEAYSVSNCVDLWVPAQDQFGTLRCPFLSSAKDGLLRCVDCDTCLLTLKALQFSEWCMPAASTGVSTSGYVTAGGVDPTIVSYRRIPLY